MSERDDIRTVRGLLAGSEDALESPEAVTLERVWRELELPPVAPPPPGFATRVVARARAERRPWLGWLGLGVAPAWARAVAVVALAGGVAAGVGLGWVAEEPVSGVELAAETLSGWGDSTMAEDFVTSAGESTGSAALGNTGNDASGEVKP